ncbi:Hypothetical predicted protein [Paramuricea clavata]|uniref:Uncharacterized protein n=1 Tax=Paramuricea clavata TaxID=317549 RepID=A0A6S7G5J9_PARCT|nr:Hypothetical predicted protein [Paramuricea clavata]
MTSPQNKKELESQLGMFTYLAQYSPHLSEKTATPERVGPVLKFYDTGKYVTVQEDASQSGLGAVLLQDGKPVAYASKALTPTQQAYAQIKKEALALVFGCEKFHHYQKQTTNL